MSIDLRVDFKRPFNVGAWARRTDEILGSLCGRRLGAVEGRIEPNVHLAWDDVTPRDSAWSTELDSWEFGPSLPGHILELRVRGWAFAVAGNIPAHPDSPTGWLEVTPARTAASLVLSLGAVIAAAELGDGTFEDNWELTSFGASSKTRPDELVSSLRLEDRNPATLEEAARGVLQNTRFKEWGVLHEPIHGASAEEWPEVWAPWQDSSPHVSFRVAD